MKKLFSLAVLAIVTFNMSCSQTSSADNAVDIDAQGPTIKFNVLEHDFGTIEKGGDGTFEFVFKNEGSEPLVLNNVRSSCGCTVPQWPREPILGGKKAGIKVKYDTRRLGPFNKSITVYSNAGSTPVVLRIKGNVVDPAQQKSASAKPLLPKN